MEYEGLDYGDNKALNDQAAAAPLTSQGTPGAGASPSSRRVLPARGPAGIFGPTDRPNEPLTAGVDFGPGPGRAPSPVIPDDPNLLLRALVQTYPHPDLVRLLNRG
jgi:hypothetical protein